MRVHLRQACQLGIYSNSLQRTPVWTLKIDTVPHGSRLYSPARARTWLGPSLCKLQTLSSSSFLAQKTLTFRDENMMQKSRKGSTLLQNISGIPCGYRQLWTGIGNADSQKRKENMQDLVEATEPRGGQVTVGQKVKQAGKDASYMGVLLVGFGVTGLLIWYVMSELLFSFSPNSVYTKAWKAVKVNASIIEAVGSTMKTYGEETSRGRRRHVSHQEYVVEGANYMRVKFYISGNKRKGTVHVDAKETSRGRFEFRYIFVELDGYPSETIVVLDNR